MRQRNRSPRGITFAKLKLHLAMAPLAFLLTSALGAEAPYGPDTCQQGFVWRDAVEGDHVCVRPGFRNQARADNAQAAYRVSTTNRSYGPDTCRQGYVWREAAPGDHVCVKPETRDQARADNAAARSRYVNR
jgi:hypothetical protein